MESDTAGQRRNRLESFWPVVILGASLLGGATNVVLSLALDGPVLLESVPRTERLAVYGSTSAVAGPLLGFVVAAVAILVALPERPSVSRLRELAAWKALPNMLLTTAGMLMLTLVLTLIGQTADASRTGDWLFEALTFASMCGSLVGLVLSGVAFALALGLVQQEDGDSLP